MVQGIRYTNYKKKLNKHHKKGKLTIYIFSDERLIKFQRDKPCLKDRCFCKYLIYGFWRKKQEKPTNIIKISKHLLSKVCK